MKVLLLSRYASLGASSRVRFFQYLPYLAEHGIEVEVSPLLSDGYLRALYRGERNWREILSGYLGRFAVLPRAHRFDAVIVEKEVFPFFPGIFERLFDFLDVPFLADYDDAWFHRYDNHSNILVRTVLGRKIDGVMRHASVVTAGNDYLAERARLAGARCIVIIPTVVDTDRYRPVERKPNAELVVGWMGTPKTSHYLRPLLPVFDLLKRKFPVRFFAVGARTEDFAGTVVETMPWSEANEVAMIGNFDVGIMPLDDTPWEEGKCGYKLIQYLACGVPVVASPVGVNCQIVKQGINGFLAKTAEEWEGYLAEMLRLGSEYRREMGLNGREDVIRHYSLHAQAPRFLETIKRMAR